MTDFDTLTPCGECCTGCDKKLRGDCPGCLAAEGRVPEWKESGACRIFSCVREHNAPFCGACDRFPCEKLPGMMPWNENIIEHLAALRREYFGLEK